MDGYEVTEIRLAFEGAVAITAVEVCDGKIYIGLTGTDVALVELDPADDSVRDTGFRFPSKGNNIMNKIHNSLAVDDGLLYIGHGSNINFDKWQFPPTFDGGHLYSFDPKSSRTEDLGLASSRSTVHALAAGEDFLFGYTIPDNHLFAYDLRNGELTDLGNLIGHDYPNHNFVCAGAKAFGVYPRPQQSLEDRTLLAGYYLFVYDHDREEFQTTDELVIEGQSADGSAGVDAWLLASNGKAYGGRIDGVLVELDPDTHRVRELGKGRLNDGPRLPGLAEHDGKIFGTAGFPVMGLFSFDTDSGSFTDYGRVTDDYPKMCYFHGMDILPDGRIYVGETDGGRPYLYRLEPK